MGDVIKEIRVKASPERIWKAITDKNEMKVWYFDLADFRPEVGFEFEFSVSHEGQEWVHLCRVTEVVPHQKLTYSWKYRGYSGESFVTFDLLPENDETRIRLTHRGLETFPSVVAAFRRENFDAGWTSIVEKNLKKHLDSIGAQRA